MKIIKHEQGFTLLELVISLALGLILVAIAVQLVFSGQSNYRIQQAASTIQDSGVFSLNAVTKNIRLANHGNAADIHDETLYGGIVLSAQAPIGMLASGTRTGNLLGLKIGTTDIVDVVGLSRSGLNTSGFGNIKSDQLVIIYQAPVDMTTCTGINVKGAEKTLNIADGTMRMNKGWYVIERYYLKQNTSTGSADLYCSDAIFLAEGEDVPSGANAVAGLTTTRSLHQNYITRGGQMIAPNVDFMKVQLLVKNKDENGVITTGTMSIAEYTALALSTVDAELKRPMIMGINMGWLVRSTDKISNAVSRSYNILGETLTPPAGDKYMRHVYTTSIALRNGGLGE